MKLNHRLVMILVAAALAAGCADYARRCSVNMFVTDTSGLVVSNLEVSFHEVGSSRPSTVLHTNEAGILRYEFGQQWAKRLIISSPPKVVLEQSLSSKKLIVKGKPDVFILVNRADGRVIMEYVPESQWRTVVNQRQHGAKK